MQDASSRQHPAGRDNDGGTRPGVEDLGGLDVPNKIRLAAAQGAVVLIHEQVHVEIVVVSIFAVNLAGIHRHWAIDKHRKIGNPLLVLQLSDVIQDLLSATCSKGGDE